MYNLNSLDNLKIISWNAWKDHKLRGIMMKYVYDVV